MSDDGARAWPVAHVGGMLATELEEVSDRSEVLEGSGRWAVVVTFEGRVTCARFGRWERRPLAGWAGEHPWRGPRAEQWTTSMDRAAYMAAVDDVRERIAAGTVYQVNVCRVLRAALPEAGEPGLVPLAVRLAERHDAPFGGLIQVPGAQVVTASPELFLRRRGGVVWSSPIKGTGRTVDDLTAKDDAENIMIVDLVRNDLSRASKTGSIAVEGLLSVEKHPGLVHLVSTVKGELAPGVGWPELLEATFPPGSVSGAPKSSALQAIADLEPVPRGPYCGAIGWVDADTGDGELAVGIRTFWAEDGALKFGTGAGITWGSDAAREWAETELKAERLVGLATC
nr:chorismate-binding protein [Phytoactinopolyspora limicola]